jgi:uncharacterized protein (DUF3084 family)
MLLKNTLITVILILFCLPALARDLSVLQAAIKVTQDDLTAAQTERDADLQFVLSTEKELSLLKKQLEAGKTKAAKSEKRYLESKKRYDKVQADLDQVLKH